VKKAILILEQQSWFGGAQRVLEAVLNSLVDDCDLVVAFPEHGPFSAALREKGIETRTFPLGTYRPGRKSYKDMAIFAVRSLFCALKLAAVIRTKRIALVYINGPRCLPAGTLAAWLAGRPSLFHLHLILTRKSEIFLVTQLARRVSKIVACSRAAAESLLNADRRLASKTEILYNPVLDRFDPVPVPLDITPGAATDHVTLGIVGRISEAKGQRLLLNAVRRLRPELQNKTRIIIAGAPAPGCPEDLRYAHGLEESARQYGLREKILWVGHQRDLAPYYALMDVLVHPSSGEALGLVILEALQRGIPVIASRTGGIPEIIRDGSNGLLISPKDEDSLVRGLERFIDDQSLRERLRAGARAGLDDRFSLKTFAPAMRNLVCQLSGASNLNKAEAPHEKLAVWK